MSEEPEPSRVLSAQCVSTTTEVLIKRKENNYKALPLVQYLALFPVVF